LKRRIVAVQFSKIYAILTLLWKYYHFFERSQIDISELKIYDAPGSKTRLRKKEICHARQKV
jgi:hypothetical protein